MLRPFASGADARLAPFLRHVQGVMHPPVQTEGGATASTVAQTQAQANQHYSVRELSSFLPCFRPVVRWCEVLLNSFPRHTTVFAKHPVCILIHILFRTQEAVYAEMIALYRRAYKLEGALQVIKLVQTSP